MLSDFDKEIVPVFFSLSHSIDAGLYTTAREERKRERDEEEGRRYWLGQFSIGLQPAYFIFLISTVNILGLNKI